MKDAIYMLLILILLISGCTKDENSEFSKVYTETFKIVVENPSDFNRMDEIVTMDIDMLKSKSYDFNADAFIVLSGSEEIPSQAIDNNGDGVFDQFKFITNIEANKKNEITIRYAKSGKFERIYNKRTQAELSCKFDGKFENRKYIGGNFKNVDFLRVPPEHTDHSFYIRYEGPGWESDKVGYRFYLDWRNATDIFGKKVDEMVLQNVGKDGFDSYHQMADWGMDILKVGESLGIGSIAMWENNKANRVAQTDSITCKVSANGPIYSQISTTYFGWQINGEKYNLISNLSIAAGSRITKHLIQITNNPNNLCTGIVKHDAAKIIKGPNSNNGWNYLATYGKQSLAADNLGMAILYKNSDFVEQNEDEHSHVTLMNVKDGKLEYYFLAAWVQEIGGLQTLEEFQQYLDLETDKFNKPLKIYKLY
jgi:hypothetical protein